MLSLIQPQDALRCAALFTQVFRGEPWLFDWLTEERAFRYIRDIIRSPGFSGFILNRENAETTLPVAFCLGCINDYFFSPHYDIKEIVVDRAYQRQGVGTQMLTKIERYLANIGVTGITLFTDKNIPAFTFYMQNGFSHSENNVYLYKSIPASDVTPESS